MSIPSNKVNFPLYAIAPLSCNHVIVSGGGGSSNTGVFNGFAICEIGYENKGYVAYEIQRRDTGSLSVMNCAVGQLRSGKLFLAAAQDADCYIYQIKVQPREDSSSTLNSSSGQEGLRHRGHENEDKSDDAVSKGLCFDIQTLTSVQTDFNSVDPYQNVVTFSPDSRIVATGGSDGVLRLWNFPEMQNRATINVSKEISDIDFSPNRKLLSVVTKDGKCKLWSVEDSKMKYSLDLPPKDEGKFFYKRCKFGITEKTFQKNRLFVILNPLPTNYKQHKSYIQHWTAPDFTLTQVVAHGEALSALAVSGSGMYLAVGSMTSGDVDIYISFSLQRLKHIEKAHKTFVTGLTFLPPAQPNEESVLAECDAAVVSISVDNQIHVHHIDKTTGVSMVIAVISIIVVIFLTLMMCSFLGL